MFRDLIASSLTVNRYRYIYMHTQTHRVRGGGDGAEVAQVVDVATERRHQTHDNRR